MAKKSKVSPSLEHINPAISFGKKSGSIIETTKEEIEPDAIGPFTTSTTAYARWGTDNNRPQTIVDENMQDGGSAGALRFKIQAHYGGGLFFFKKRVDGDKEIITPVLEQDLPQEIQDFIFDTDIENFVQGIVSDFEWWSFYYVQYIKNKAGNKIIDIKWQRAKDIRAGLRNEKTGAIDNWHLSGDWGAYAEPTNIAVVPNFDRKNPFAKANAIYRHGVASIDKDYYPTPYWQSNMRWLAVAKKIPEWINANIDNSVNIKYHIEIPQAYFLALHPIELYNDVQTQQQAIQTSESAIKIQIDEVLAGAKNVSKTFYTKFILDENGSVQPGWKINELKNDIKDGAWLNAYGTAAAAIATAHGVPPSLQGLILSNGLGTGSGSDTREQFNFYLQLNTVIPRQTTAEWWEFLKRFNNWPKDLYIGHKSIILQSMNENKSGFEKQAETTPTSGDEKTNS